METFRARTFSGSGDDVYEIENGTERSGRTVLNEHTSRFNGLDSDTLDNRSPKSADQDSDEHSIHKKNPKDYSYLYTYLSTTLFVIVLIVENIFQFRLFIDSNASISFYWLESCVIALFFRFWGRRRIRSFRSQASHFLPVLFLHVAVVTLFSVDFNHGNYGSSGGSESYLVYIALTPPAILLASWLTSRECYPDKVVILLVMSSAFVMVLFCSMEDPYAYYKMSFTDGVFGFMMAVSLAFFTVHAKKCLSQATLAELLYHLNFSCVMCLPFIALLLGELRLLGTELFERVKVNHVIGVLILALLRLASQASCLYQLKYSTALLNATSRGFAWIWITLAITFMTPGHTGEFLIPVFLSFWIYGFLTYLPALCSDLRWI